MFKFAVARPAVVALGTNGSTLANWADRPTSTTFGTWPNGEQPYEYIVDLVNLTGKDC